MTVQCPYCTAGNDRIHLPPSTVNKTDESTKAAQLLLLSSSSLIPLGSKHLDQSAVVYKSKTLLAAPPNSSIN